MRGGVGETVSANLDIEDLQEFIKNPPAYNASEFDTPSPGMPYALVNDGTPWGIANFAIGRRTVQAVLQDTNRGVERISVSLLDKSRFRIQHTFTASMQMWSFEGIDLKDMLYASLCDTPTMGVQQIGSNHFNTDYIAICNEDGLSGNIAIPILHGMVDSKSLRDAGQK